VESIIIYVNHYIKLVNIYSGGRYGMNTQQKRLRNMINIAFFAAIIGVLAQVTIPLPFIPITGQTLAIGLAATILGSRLGTFSVLLYVLIGIAGVPVFSQMSAGLGVVLGPTGGFIIGFIPTAFFTGYILEKSSFTYKNAIIANIVGMIITLTFGTVWYKFVMDVTWVGAFTTAFTPFIIVGIIKAVLASWVGIIVRERLISANLIYPNARSL